MPAGQMDPARWATVAAAVETLRGDPEATLKPRPPDSQDTGGRRAIAQVGRRLGSEEDRRVELHEVLGQGGMGVVRRGTQAVMGREVAVKSLRPDRRSGANRVKLLQEAWLTGALEHPNIIPIYDIEHGDEEPLVLLRRVDNVTWGDLMGDADTVRARFGAEDLLDWNLRVFMQVCNAVHFAHDRRVLHLDLKPDNVLIGRFGEVYVVDWGIALSLEDDGSGRLPLARDNREIIGTPAYLAPEMLLADGELLSEQTDVYLLGACLYAALSGQPPHRGGSIAAILTRAALEDPPAPEGAPAGLVEIVARAIDRDPARRQRSADELRLEVQRYLERRGSRERCAEAQLRLEQLRGALAQAEPAHPEPGLEQSIYDHFGACRFGFHGALREWPGNAEAADGLSQSVLAMVNYELAKGHPQAAAALTAELDAVSDQLAARIEAAFEAQARERARIEGLERLDADLDLTTGQRTRVFLIGVMATLWVVLPLLGHLFGGVHSPSAPRVMVGLPLGFLMLTGIGMVWARESLTATAVNRRLIGALVVVLSGQCVFTLGGLQLGMEIAQLIGVGFVLWASAVAYISLFADRRLWPSTAGFLASFALHVTWPDLGYVWIAAGSAVFLVNVLAGWWPARSRSAEEARASITRR